MYASLYPNIIAQFNIAMNTQVGMVNIPEQIHDQENRRNNENWIRSGAFFEDYHTHNWINLGKRWFNLMGVMELVEYMKYYFSHVVRPTCMYGFDESIQPQYWQPVILMEGGWSPVIFEPEMNNEKIEEFLDYVAANPNQKYR